MGASLDRKAFLEGVALSKPFLEILALQDVRARAERIAGRARALAPEGDATDPHAGELKADLGLKGEGIDSKGPYVDVGTNAHTAAGDPYPLYVEFGTEKMVAQPFMRPAIAEESGSSVVPTRLKLAPRPRKTK